MAKASRTPTRLKRSESFLGIHFDFHASDDCTQIGKNVTRRMVRQIVDQVRPDYVQCDCKGHRGLSSYMTHVGHRAPGFVRDPLRIWRDVTAERGVALYMHFSGVWDSEAVKRHPSWAQVDADGTRSKNNTSVFGPYVDKLLIPQLRELADEYGVDGVWVDGECWATCQDYGRKAIAAFRAETGIRKIPRKPTDPHFVEFTEFCREGFRRYVDHYVTAMHRHNPDFQIASNWAYTSFMPEPVSLDVDYVSGDYPMQNSVNAARFEARCLVHQPRPWDLMAWSFTGRWEDRCRSTKSVVQLQQEAAVVLSVGGGFQAYFKQKRDGSIHGWTMKLMAETAKFCRARQSVCHRARPVPQVGLLYATADYYRKAARLFGPWGGELTAMQGVLRMLLESQESVEVLMEHHVTGRMADYPLLVVPEWGYLRPAFKKELLAYVHGGGNLLLVGPESAALFKRQLGVRFVGKPAERKLWLEHDGWLAGVDALHQKVRLGQGVRAFGRLYAEDDNVGPSDVAASVAKHGRGKIAAVYLNLGQRYCTARTAVARTFLNALVRKLFAKPIVEVSGSQYVDVQVNRIDGKLAVNLMNTAGPHHNPDVYVYDEVPPVGPLEIIIRTGRKPKKVIRQPGGSAVRHQYRKGEVTLTVGRLKIHDILVVE